MGLNGEEHILPQVELDQGKTEMILHVEGGRVVIRFREPRLWVAFDPPNAVQVGKNLIDCAVQCGARVEIQVPRREVSMEKREALTARAMHIFRSMSDKGRPPAVIARHVVDSILASIE